MAEKPIQVSIIVPTYNEAENIDELLDRVHATLKDFSHEVIVVDDDSPDKTWKIVEKRFRNEDWIKVVRRTTDRGLSKAVIEGFNLARGELLGVIDADLQHDETILPDMIAASEKAAIVVGSRYVQGGGVGNWSFTRRAKSWLATQFASLLLNVSVKDPMAGFFIVERYTYEKIKDKINSQGFKILLEILYFANCEVVEVPYCFRTRKAGESKLTSKVVLEFFSQVFRLRMKNPIPQGFLRYCIVGLSGVFVDMGIFWIVFTSNLFPVEICGVVSGQSAIISNFLLNDNWTFCTRRGNNKLLDRFWRFEIACLLGLLNKAMIISLTVRQFAINPIVGNIAAISIAIFSNFILSKLWAWKN